MRLAEQKIWDTMRRNRPSKFWLLRVENMVGEGFPDVVSIAPDSLTLVELKAPIRPARETSLLLKKDDVRLAQINWHLKAATKNLPTFFLMRDDKGALYLIEGRHAAELTRTTLHRARKLSIASTWPRIFDILGDSY